MVARVGFKDYISKVSWTIGSKESPIQAKLILLFILSELRSM